LEKVAKKLGKKVIYIDNHGINAQIAFACTILPVLIAGENIISHKELKTIQ
jgi:hypothetical protein